MHVSYDHEYSKTDGSAMAKARVHCCSRLHDRICSCCSAPSVYVLRVFLSFWGARCGHMHAPTWPSAEKLSSRRALGSALPSARPWAASRVTLDHGVRGTRATSQPKRACLGESGRLPATPGPPPKRPRWRELHTLRVILRALGHVKGAKSSAARANRPTPPTEFCGWRAKILDPKS